MIPHLQRVVDAVAAVPRGVAQSDLLAAVLEGARQGPTPEVATMLLDAVAVAYERASLVHDPALRPSGSVPRMLTAVDTPLRQVEHETRKALDLGATPRTILAFVANGLTGRINGPVERAAADLMAASYDDAVRTIPQPHKVPGRRDTYKTWTCRDLDHPRCRGGWRSPSGWMPCTCTCHTKEPTT